MKKLLIAALALMMIVSYSDAFAQGKATLRLGGGVITDGTQPGGGLGLDLNMPDKPISIGVTTEFYKKSGVTTLPVGVLALLKKTNENGKVTLLLGAGSGLVYSKVEVTFLGTTVSASTTKALITALGGIQFNFSEKAGFYVKGQYYRAITSGASNLVGIGGGIAIALGAE